MYFRKFPHPANFSFLKTVSASGRGRIGRAALRASIDRHEGDVFRVRVQSPLWGPNPSIAGLTPPRRSARGTVGLARDGALGLTLRDAQGRVLLRSVPRRAFGVSGERSLFMFERQEGDQFYGMGEKLLGLELSGKQSNFWNTDVFADFHWKEIFDDRPDPLYASIPYLIVKRGPTYIGLLLDNPHATFLSTGAEIEIGGGQMKLGAPKAKAILVGAHRGEPDLFVIVGPTLPELTRKAQSLVGRTPLPPAWALGYHQCRWGYRSAADMENLDRNFKKHGIPCDGLWIDIDYMDAFKVFTFHPKTFPKMRQTLKALRANGRRLIPILDPGVKKQKGYAVYDEGHRRDIFCRNMQGEEFVGLVWPGETAFPDFSLPEARAWWARHVATMAEIGVEGAWIDMNDPSTGAVLNEDMLFRRGKAAHDTFHNQYALGMAVATRAGLEAAHPGKRVFVISRSGHTGMSRHSAIWTGDNCSNYHHLRLSIPCSLNLALSGVPFNGPDIGGFAGDANAALLRDWQKACFLFPFCRNHSATGTRRQEPWAFDSKTLAVCKHYIRLRYKLRPYLYNLFIRHEETGEAILRPIFYDFAETPDLPLGRIEDQFMVGHAILQAPIVWEKAKAREVALPGPAGWWSAAEAKWLRGPRKVTARAADATTPLYVREGSIVPMARGEPTRPAFNPRDIEAHLFLRRSTKGAAVSVYAYDDGETLKYRDGKRSELGILARVRAGSIEIATEALRRGYGDCRVRLVLYDRFAKVALNGREVTPRPAAWTFCGARHNVWIV